MNKYNISVKILDNIQGRKNKKETVNNSRMKAQKAKVEANKWIKSIRGDKRKYVDGPGTTVEQAAREHLGQLYDTTKRLEENIVNQSG